MVSGFYWHRPNAGIEAMVLEGCSLSKPAWRPARRKSLEHPRLSSRILVKHYRLLSRRAIEALSSQRSRRIVAMTDAMLRKLMALELPAARSSMGNPISDQESPPAKALSKASA